jgi:hypothetical protein
MMRVPHGIRWYEPLSAGNVVLLDGEPVLVAKFPGQDAWMVLWLNA